MNKLTKLGVSALCGSLAAISTANAGDMTVTGGVDMSWISLPKAETGNPIGIGSNYTLSGSGELDNGWSVALSIAATNRMAYSTTNVPVTVPSLGFGINPLGPNTFPCLPILPIIAGVHTNFVKSNLFIADKL